MNANQIAVLLTGLSGAGKTTIGREIVAAAGGHDGGWELLDGDELRKTISSDLGFTSEDREAHLTRVATYARTLMDAGQNVVLTMIAPTAHVRQVMRNIIEGHGRRFKEVYVSTSLHECERRDVKGLYQRARAGEIEHFTGISAPYEVPTHPDMAIDTVGSTPTECAAQILAAISR